MERSYYYSLYHWTGGPRSTAKRVDALRAAGVAGLEFGSRPDHESGVEAFLRGLGGSTILHNYFPPPLEPFVFNVASPDPTIRQRSLDLARRALWISAEIGAPCYAIHAGFVVDPNDFDGVSYVFPSATAEDREDAHRRFVDAVHVLGTEADSAGVRLLIENNVCPARLRGKLLLQLSEEFARMFDDLGPTAPRIGILLDTGHLLVSAATFGRDAAGFVRDHRERILGLHLHENDRAEDRHWMVTGQGPAMHLARACGYAEWVTIEANCRTLGEIASQMTLVRAAFGDRDR